MTRSSRSASTRCAPSSKQKLDELEHVMELRNSGSDGFETARAIMFSDEGKLVMDTLRSDGPGKSAEFVVALPFSGNAALPTVRAAMPRPRGRLRICIIDDDEDGAGSLYYVLELEGHEVHVAMDGELGIDLLLAVHPDVVLCDLGLPGLDGFEVARHVDAAAGGGLAITAHPRRRGGAPTPDRGVHAVSRLHGFPVELRLPLQHCTAPRARAPPLPVSEPCADQAVQGDLRLSGLDRQLAMDLGRNSHLELPAIPAGRQRFWDG